jgi:hypothetical protein
MLLFACMPRAAGAEEAAGFEHTSGVAAVSVRVAPASGPVTDLTDSRTSAQVSSVNRSRSKLYEPKPPVSRRVRVWHRTTPFAASGAGTRTAIGAAQTGGAAGNTEPNSVSARGGDGQTANGGGERKTPGIVLQQSASGAGGLSRNTPANHSAINGTGLKRLGVGTGTIGGPAPGGTWINGTQIGRGR